MKIVADANIPFIEEVFQSIGTVTTVNGRQMNPDAVQDADVLLVRSVTKVDRDLLQDSAVKFVGTATIGTDHVDIDYLKSRNIGFASAPGSNAISAAEYVISSLFVLAKKQGFKLEEKTVGIIGCGNVGSYLLSCLQALDIQCLVYDPPRAQQFNDRDYVSWEEVIQADIVTAHVPLTFEGDYPTYRMFDAPFFTQLKGNAVFINTSRGRVVDEGKLLTVLQKRTDLQLVLDVWEGEPNINTTLMCKAAIATPHIAGYSLDGKVRGTQMVYQAACRFFNQPEAWDIPPLPFADTFTAMQFNNSSSDIEVIYQSVLNAYDVMKDDQKLRKMLDLEQSQGGEYFDELRKSYPIRREFSNYEVIVSQARSHLSQSLKGLGFQVETASNLLTA